MTPAQVIRRLRRKLLEEVRTGKLGWYYISMASEAGFAGAVVVEARGPAEANNLMHSLGLYQEGCESLCLPVPEEALPMIKDSEKYRLLNKREAENLGGG